MQDPLSHLQALTRPRLMVRAARIGLSDYRRAHHLPRLLGRVVVPRSAEALMHLIDMESEIESQRTDADPAYSAVRHLDVMIAMMGEARLLRTAHIAAPT